MCTVLRQHLARTEAGLNGIGGLQSNYSDVVMVTTSSTSPTTDHFRAMSPNNNIQSYSYLRDPLSLKKPVDVYDRKLSEPAKLKHFHLPYGPDGFRLPARSRSAYANQLHGRRARSHSRTGMRALVHELEAATPRPRSPHMNNEEPIRLSHYPDGRDTRTRPQSRGRRKKVPIERDDFPAPPFPYAVKKRTRRWSEPSKKNASPVAEDPKDPAESPQVQEVRAAGTEEVPMTNGTKHEPAEEEDDDDDLTSCSESEMDDGPVETLETSEDETDALRDPKLEKTEAELKKISSGMSKVFLAELAAEKERKRLASKKPLDPRSAARTPAANREPRYRLRFESPIEASPSRIARHAKPWSYHSWHTWTDSSDRGQSSTPHVSPMAPMTPSTPPIKQGFGNEGSSSLRAATLPARFSPSSSTRDASWEREVTASESAEPSQTSSAGPRPASCSTPARGYGTSMVRQSATWGGRSAGSASASASGGRASPSAGSASGGSACEDSLGSDAWVAPNAYPLHLLLTTNYRLPGDVDRNNLEKHLTEADFEAVFRLSREDFYRIPFWKRCEIKRKLHLF